MIARTITIGNRPLDLSAVEINGNQAAIRWFKDRHALGASQRLPGATYEIHVRTRRRRDELHDDRGMVRRDVQNIRLRIERSAWPIRAAVRTGHVKRTLLRCGNALPRYNGGSEDRAEDVLIHGLNRLLAQFRREVDEIVN